MIRAFLLGGLVALLGLFGATYGFFIWLNTPVEAGPVPLRDLVIGRVEAGNCGDALSLAHLAVVERASGAAAIWREARHESVCQYSQRASVFDGSIDVVFSVEKIGSQEVGDIIWGSPYAEWGYVAEAPPGGGAVLVFRRSAFALQML